MIRQLFVAAVLGVVILAGCHSGHDSASQASANAGVTVYHLRGRVVSTDPASGVVVLNHEAIPGFMGAMTMPYQLKNPGIVSELHPGDTITADVLVSKSSEQTVLLDNIDVVAQGKPDYKPKVIYHVPAPGDVVPDFVLRNQDGREIHLRQFRGKALLITFIYTRCPLPNFCPLITRNFAVINKTLQQNAKVYAKTQLLCVSFDPDNDTPARLKAYGAEYLGSDAPSAFAHWQFAVPTKPVLAKMAQYFDVGITYGANDAITHTLSTTLIGPDGKVARFYPDNDWSPQQVAADITRLEAKKG
ncbi:MAG TPA: SCO family protein [Terracidiphilus sp.]|nr:SCO family protein [Terracidiphilus sp.]